MNWFLLTLLSVVLVSFANILRRVLMKGDKSNPYSYAVVFSFLLGIINLFFALLTHATFVINIPNFISILVASILWGAAAIFLFKAMKELEASEVTILSTLRVVVTISASVIFLHETFSLQRIFGAVIIILSVFLVSGLKKEFQFNAGVGYTLATAFFSGLALVADSYNVAHMSVLGYNTMANFLIGILLLMFYPKAVRQWRHFIQPYFLQRMLPLALFSGLQAIAYLFALSVGGVTAQMGTIYQSSVILTVLLAIFFLGERSHLVRKILAAFLVTGGVLLLG